jgi:hypothetical protein
MRSINAEVTAFYDKSHVESEHQSLLGTTPTTSSDQQADTSHVAVTSTYDKSHVVDDTSHVESSRNDKSLRTETYLSSIEASDMSSVFYSIYGYLSTVAHVAVGSIR